MGAHPIVGPRNTMTVRNVTITAAYGAWYLWRVLRRGAKGDGVVYDFYGFCRWGTDKIGLVAAVMLLVTWVIAALLMLGNHLFCLG